MKPIAYRNGKFIPASQLSIPVHDASFVWGATVTDRVRTFNGQLFRLDDHLQRFRRSCDGARVPLTESDKKLATIAKRLVRKNRHAEELSLILIASPGPVDGLAAFRSKEKPSPTLIAYTRPIDRARTERLQRLGESLVSVPIIASIDAKVKHRSRLSWWMALQRVHDQAPEAQPLFLDFLTQHVLETPTSNIVAVLDGELVSPSAGSVLEGISLAVVKDLCDQIGIEFVRRDIERREIGRSTEILLTNTTDSVVGVSQLDGRPIPFPGPVLLRLLDAWSKLVGVNLREEIGGER